MNGIFVARWVDTNALSAILSFCRTIIFMVLPVLVLPRIFGIGGVWYSLAAGEIMSITHYFLKYCGMRQRPEIRES